MNNKLLYIDYGSFGFCLRTQENIFYDYKIATFLDIRYEEYIGILKMFNAYCCNGEFYFKKMIDAEEAIKYIEDKYLILNKLRGIC